MTAWLCEYKQAYVNSQPVPLRLGASLTTLFKSRQKWYNLKCKVACKFCLKVERSRPELQWLGLICLREPDRRERDKHLKTKLP